MTRLRLWLARLLLPRGWLIEAAHARRLTWTKTHERTTIKIGDTVLFDARESPPLPDPTGAGEGNTLVPDAVLFDLESTPGAIGWKTPDTEPGDGDLFTIADLAREVLGLRAAARRAIADHVEKYGQTPSHDDDEQGIRALTRLLPESPRPARPA